MPNQTKYYVHPSSGVYLGAFSEGNPNIPVNSTEVPSAPDNAAQVWNFGTSEWGDHPPHVKIYDMVTTQQKEKHYHDIDYTTQVIGGLFPKRLFSFGELYKVEWYADEAMTNLILKTEYTYTRNSMNLALYRWSYRTWYMTDGTEAPDIKSKKKLYTINPQDQLDEIILRRTNNVRQINMSLIGIVPILSGNTITQQQMIAYGQQFFNANAAERELYINDGSDALELAVRNDATMPWMDIDATSLGISGVADVRGYIIYNLSYGQRTS